MTKKDKLKLKNKIWQKFCKLDRLAQYEETYDSCQMFDDFYHRVGDEEDVEELKLIAQAISSRLKKSKR